MSLCFPKKWVPKIARSWILVLFQVANWWDGFAEHIRFVGWFIPNTAKRRLVPSSLQVNHSSKSMIDQKTGQVRHGEFCWFIGLPRGRKKPWVIRVIRSHGSWGLPVGRAFLVAFLQTIVCQVDGWEGSCGSKLNWIRKWDQYIYGYSTTMYHQNQEMVHLKKGTNFRKTHTLQVLSFFIEGHCCSMLPLLATNRPGNLPLYNAIGDPVGQWWSEFFRKQELMGWVGLRRTLQILGRVKDEGKQGHVYFDVYMLIIKNTWFKVIQILKWWLVDKH